MHWYLAIIYNPGALIADPGSIENAICVYDEADNDSSVEISGFNLNTATQALDSNQTERNININTPNRSPENSSDECPAVIISDDEIIQSNVKSSTNVDSPASFYGLKSDNSLKSPSRSQSRNRKNTKAKYENNLQR